jgi:D-ribitol-5-phosphate cytidylyltransferase
VVEAYDTIVQSDDGQFLTQIPKRDIMYQGQTPQSFKIKKLVELYESLTEEQKSILTDACKIFTLFGEKVKIVRGEVFNVKITTPFDLKVANAILQERMEK